MPETEPVKPTPPNNNTPWHTGVDADVIGHWQAKGWSMEDPKAIAVAATQAYKGVEKLIGTPPEQMIRVPKDASDQAGWKAFYGRLGAPNDPKEYDFSTVKHVDDKPPDAALVDIVRNVAAQFNLPKDRAPDLLKSVVKILDDGRAADRAAIKNVADTEQAALDKSWGLNKEVNKLEALKGAQKLGLSTDDIANLANSVGFAKTMEALRRVGESMREGSYVADGGGNNNGRPATIEAAQSRKDALQKDEGWTKRFLAGDVQARQEMLALNAQIHGYEMQELK